MAHNPQAPQGPDGNPDPAGSTQMFRAFVSDGSSPASGPATTSSSGSRVGLIVGVLVAIVAVAAVVWLAVG